jgi:bifunctional DNA-binding transcriptional regulator/antitoxin component of YhaV-PrlF toxin-antitoxin module
MNVLRTHLDKNGRLLIPQEIRKQYNMNYGDTYVIKAENNIIQIMSIDAIVDKMHELFFKHKPKTDASIVDEFLKSRREEYELERKKEEKWVHNKDLKDE